MKKTVIGVLLLLVLSAALIVSCSQNAGENVAVGEELVDISFSTMVSRALTATREAFDEKEYVWKYEAVKDDATGLKTGETDEAEYVVPGGKTVGLKGKTITGLSQGYWNFTLYAYKAIKEGGTVTGHSGVYSFKGTVTHQKVVKGSLAEVKVTVSPNTQGKGSIVFSPSILLKTLGGADYDTFTGDVRMGFGVKAYGTDTPIDSSEWDELDAGTYIVTVQVYYKDDPGIVFATESKIVTVYTGLTTTIGGSVGELSAGIQFGDVTAEIIEATTPVITEATTGATVEFQSSSTIQVTASLPTSTAKEILGTAEEGTTKEMTLTLEVQSNDTTVDPQTKETSKVYDISLMQTTVTKNNTDGAVTSEVGIIKNLSEGTDPTKLADYYLTATLEIDAGLDDVSVTHSGLAMKAFSGNAPDYAQDTQGTVGSEQIWKGFYKYNKSTGVLTIVTRSFSPFEVFFTEPTVVTYPVAVYDADGNFISGYSTVQAAVDAAAAGQTVKLLADIEVGAEVVIANGKNIVFDLNGHELSAALKETGRHYYAIENYGTVVIKDSGVDGKIVARGIENLGGTMTIESGTFYSIDGNGGACVWNENERVLVDERFIISASDFDLFVDSDKEEIQQYSDYYAVEAFSSDYTYLSSGYVINGEGGVSCTLYYKYEKEESVATLTINDGSFIVEGGTPTQYFGAACVNSREGSVLTINSGIMTSDNTRCYAIIANGTTVIYDAEVYGKHGGLSIDGGGILTVNGGSFESPDYYGLWVTNDSAGGTNVVVNGGSFKGGSIGGNALKCSVDDGHQDMSDAAVVVNGGTFTGYGTSDAIIMIPDSSTHTWELTVKGGKYSTDPSKYLAPGYFAVLGTDGYYTVEYDADLMTAAQAKGLTVVETGIEDFSPNYSSVSKYGFRYADGKFVNDETVYRFYSDGKLYIRSVSEVDGTSYVFRVDVDGIRGWGNNTITAITINSPLELAEKPFGENTALTTVTFSSDATRIPARMFWRARKLTNVSLPDTMTTIERGSFQECTDLETLVLPSNLTEIPMELVNGCTKLSSMNIPKTVTSIGNDAIRQVALTKVEIPSGVRSIGTQAFRDCDQLVEIDVYIDSTKGLTIAQNAFSNVASPVPKTDMNIYNHDVFGFIAALNLSSASHITLVDMTENQVM